MLKRRVRKNHSAGACKTQRLVLDANNGFNAGPQGSGRGGCPGE